jgi:hypothetical protein
LLSPIWSRQRRAVGAETTTPRSPEAADVVVNERDDDPIKDNASFGQSSLTHRRVVVFKEENRDNNSDYAYNDMSLQNSMSLTRFASSSISSGPNLDRTTIPDDQYAVSMSSMRNESSFASNPQLDSGGFMGGLTGIVGDFVIIDGKNPYKINRNKT